LVTISEEFSKSLDFIHLFKPQLSSWLQTILFFYSKKKHFKELVNRKTMNFSVIDEREAYHVNSDMDHGSMEPDSFDWMAYGS
jgi:hypothetical protein